MRRNSSMTKPSPKGERAIALDPNNADSYAVQAEVLNFAGRPEEALRTVEQAMRLNPRYPPWYLFELGWAYRLTGRYAEAIATLKEAISRNPNFLPAHLHLAVSYLRQWVSQQSPAAQTLEPAVAAAQRALALNDSFPWNHIVLGYIYLYQQQYEQALAEMERAVALAPTEAWSYAALAEVLSCMGRTEDALEAAAQALRLKPVIADDHLASVGAAYAVAGRYEEAIAPLQRYLSRYPNILRCPSHAGSGLQRVRPRRRGAGGGGGSAAAQSQVLTGGSQAENADQRSSGVGAAYCRVAQGGAEMSEP